MAVNTDIVKKIPLQLIR